MTRVRLALLLILLAVANPAVACLQNGEWIFLGQWDAREHRYHESCTSPEGIGHQIGGTCVNPCHAEHYVGMNECPQYLWDWDYGPDHGGRWIDHQRGGRRGQYRRHDPRYHEDGRPLIIDGKTGVAIAAAAGVWAVAHEVGDTKRSNKRSDNQVRIAEIEARRDVELAKTQPGGWRREAESPPPADESGYRTRRVQSSPLDFEIRNETPVRMQVYVSYPEPGNTGYRLETEMIIDGGDTADAPPIPSTVDIYTVKVKGRAVLPVGDGDTGRFTKGLVEAEGAPYGFVFRPDTSK